MKYWHIDVSSSEKCLKYRLFKESHGHGQYLDTIWIFCQVKSCIRDCIYFSHENNYLPIKRGRWLGIPKNERVCSYCNANPLGDGFHYLFSCLLFSKIYL